MCELFGMSSRLPATVNFQLEEFSQHGGLTGPHKDGWGIAYYDDGDVRLFKEAEPASGSDVVRFIEAHDLRSTIVLSHIRHATRGGRALKNTQPFVRELGGRMHVFAHNGDIPTLEARGSYGPFRPIGDTDSERAFCMLLGRMVSLWRGADCDGAPPPLAQRVHVVAEFAAAVRDLGPSNFLYSDGDALFAHGDRRKHEGLGGPIAPPGLYLLCRSCTRESGPIEAQGFRLWHGDEDQRVVMLASVPLTREAWEPLTEGELVVVAGGTIVRDAKAIAGP